MAAYKFTASDRFWKHFDKLPEAQKRRAMVVFEIFKKDPFDRRLRTHKINGLSGVMKRTVYAAEVEGDLRVLFYMESNTVVSFNIGRHDIYRT